MPVSRRYKNVRVVHSISSQTLGPMIDNFALALTHGLLLLAAWRLINRDDLDVEDPPEQDKEPTGFGTGTSGGDRDA